MNCRVRYAIAILVICLVLLSLPGVCLAQASACPPQWGFRNSTLCSCRPTEFGYTQPEGFIFCRLLDNVPDACFPNGTNQPGRDCAPYTINDSGSDGGTDNGSGNDGGDTSSGDLDEDLISSSEELFFAIEDYADERCTTGAQGRRIRSALRRLQSLLRQLRRLEVSSGTADDLDDLAEDVKDLKGDVADYCS